MCVSVYVASIFHGFCLYFFLFCRGGIPCCYPLNRKSIRKSSAGYEIDRGRQGASYVQNGPEVVMRSGRIKENGFLRAGRGE